MSLETSETSLTMNAIYHMASPLSGQDKIESCAVIGYPSGQDGVILPARELPAVFPQKPYNKFFID